jgi:hypothetical protein
MSWLGRSDNTPLLVTCESPDAPSNENGDFETMSVTNVIFKLQAIRLAEKDHSCIYHINYHYIFRA